MPRSIFTSGPSQGQPNGVHGWVGAMRGMRDGGGRNMVSFIASGSKMRVAANRSSGIPLTRRSVDHSGTLPDQIMLFREPIMRLSRVPSRSIRRFGAGRENAKRSSRESLEYEIRVTLLHEMGHHFGLDEDELAELGYA